MIPGRRPPRVLGREPVRPLLGLGDAGVLLLDCGVLALQVGVRPLAVPVGQRDRQDHAVVAVALGDVRPFRLMFSTPEH